MDVSSRRPLTRRQRRLENSTQRTPHENGAESSSGDDFDIDRSILKQVKAAVGRVAEFQNGDRFISDDENPLPSGRDVPKNTLSSSELLDVRISELREEMARVEVEVEQLEKGVADVEGGVAMLGETEERGGVLQQMMDDIIHSATSSCSSSGSITYSEKQKFLDSLTRSAYGKVEPDEEISLMRDHVRLNEALSGITIEAANWEVIKNDGTELLREHTHSGSVEGYSFNVTFVAREDPGRCSRDGVDEADMFSRTDRILSLKPQVDSRAASDLRAFLTRVSVDGDLLEFYQMYELYCLAWKCRTDTWRLLQTTLGQSVTLASDVHGKRLSYSSRTRESLHFTWDILVPTYGIVIEDNVAVQIKKPTHASNDKQKTLLLSVPHLLQTLVKQHGVRKGLLLLFKRLEPDAQWQT